MHAYIRPPLPLPPSIHPSLNFTWISQIILLYIISIADGETQFIMSHLNTVV